MQFCKQDTGVFKNHPKDCDGEERMQIERCLVQNYLLTKGMDYFGKKDLIYIDMLGDQDVGKLYTTAYTPPPPKEEDDEWT